MSTIEFFNLPPFGQPLAGGTYYGITTKPDGKCFAIALLDDKPTTNLTWKAAMAWAKDLQAELPTRPVAAMLFTNARGQFEKAWHWTSEEYDGSCAWDQYFYDGGQDYYSKSFEGRARAVRLIEITA